MCHNNYIFLSKKKKKKEEGYLRCMQQTLFPESLHSLFYCIFGNKINCFPPIKTLTVSGFLIGTMSDFNYWDLPFQIDIMGFP